MREWVAAMRAGDYDRAWHISDQSLARSLGSPRHDGPRHQQRIWRGEPLCGRTVLVRCYHGLGDTIQFIRFARPLRAAAREVIVWCQPELVGLVAGVAGVDRVIPLHDGEPELDFDVDMEVMEIPHAIRATREQVTMRAPYLRPSDGPMPEFVRSSAAFCIGVAWRSGDWDLRRSFPADELAQLRLPGTRLCSLQRGAAAADAARIGACDISVADLSVLASRLRALDLVVCPDGMVAHLAAALGCPTWIVLPADCDWRWPARGRSTPWYPTVRLFHQTRRGHWSRPFADVRAALAAHTKRRRLLSAAPTLPSPASAPVAGPDAQPSVAVAADAGSSG